MEDAKLRFASRSRRKIPVDSGDESPVFDGFSKKRKRDENEEDSDDNKELRVIKKKKKKIQTEDSDSRKDGASDEAGESDKENKKKSSRRQRSIKFTQLVGSITPLLFFFSACCLEAAHRNF